MTKAYEEKLRDVLGSFIDLFCQDLDCDGSTRFVAYMLQKLDVDFDIYAGEITKKNDSSNIIPIHYWIITKNKVLFDFKTKKWLGVLPDKVKYILKGTPEKDHFLFAGEEPKILGMLLWYSQIIKKMRLNKQ